MPKRQREEGIFISASSMRDYIKCSKMAYYRLFEPELGVQNREMVLGSVVHKVLEKAWQNIDVALNLGKVLADREGIDAVGKQAVEHFIYIFFENFTPLITREDKIEKYFKIKLQQYDDVYLVGKFDRVTRGIVLDWKTTANPPKTVENDPQFIIYDLAYRLIYDKSAEGIYYASLKNGKLIRYNESKEHASTLIDHIIPEYVEDIRKKNFVKEGLFNGACYRCPFKIPCLGENRGLVYSEFIEE